ncbi:MAG: hypothetical protein IJR35_11325, partial [Synergistaceae bacterium]|nr:hypothetical protein [Synergistaceae bacterium]
MCDGKTLYADRLQNSTGVSLVIYGQSGGSGTLNIIPSGNDACISCTKTGTSVTINGGTVNVTNQNNGSAFIRGAAGVTINGGTVNVTCASTDGQSHEAYITSTNGNVTINGGTVNVTNTSSKDGVAYIHTGSNNTTGGITINGGQVTVTGKDLTTSKSGIKSNGLITLGYTKYTDFIQAYDYKYSTLTIATGKTFAVMKGDEFTTLEAFISTKDNA